MVFLWWTAPLLISFQISCSSPKRKTNQLYKKKTQIDINSFNKTRTTTNNHKLLCRVFKHFPSANQLVISDVSLDSRHMTGRHWTDKGGFKMIAIIAAITAIITKQFCTWWRTWLLSFPITSLNSVSVCSDWSKKHAPLGSCACNGNNWQPMHWKVVEGEKTKGKN